MRQCTGDGVYQISENLDALVRAKPVPLRFGLLMCQPRALAAIPHYVFDLETTCLGPNVVHGDEVVDCPASIGSIEISTAETLERNLEPVFEVSYETVNILGTVDFEKPHASNRPFCGLIPKGIQVPGLSGIGLAPLKREIP